MIMKGYTVVLTGSGTANKLIVNIPGFKFCICARRILLLKLFKGQLFSMFTFGAVNYKTAIGKPSW